MHAKIDAQLRPEHHQNGLPKSSLQFIATGSLYQINKQVGQDRDSIFCRIMRIKESKKAYAQLKTDKR